MALARLGAWQQLFHIFLGHARFDLGELTRRRDRFTKQIITRLFFFAAANQTERGNRGYGPL